MAKSRSARAHRKRKGSLAHPFARMAKLVHHGGYPEGDADHPPKEESNQTSTAPLCIDYGPEDVQTQKISDPETFFNQSRPGCSAVRWIRVIGRPDPEFLQALADHYNFHPLAIEDLIQIPQRPKVDEYEESEEASYLAIIASAPSRRDGVLSSQQISIFVADGMVVSFEEYDDGLTDRITDRLRIGNSKIRHAGADFLMYCMLDNVVDRLFPILVELGDELESLDDQVMDDPDVQQMRSIHEKKRDMMMLRREVWPMREMLQSLRLTDHVVITEPTRVYIRDVYDHCIHIVDMMETYRDAITSILDIHMNMMSNKMNEVMKVLTIIATIFIPLSFLSGVFGMNFTKSLPGQDNGYAFSIFVFACCALGLGMLGLFWWRKWL